jgi:imidazolonepropionase-like amidohydrolase
MKNAVVCALLSSSLAFSIAAADTPPAAPDAGSTVIVLKAAHLFDGKSGQLQSPGVVLVRGQRIAVGAACRPRRRARVIDLGDATLPGFIDAHTPWPRPQRHGRRLLCGHALRPRASFHAARNARALLMAGVTSAREVGAPDFVDVALRNAIRDGLAEGPRLLVAGHAIGSTGGHCDGPPIPPARMPPAGPLEGVCNGPDECRFAVRQQMKSGGRDAICARAALEADPVDASAIPEELVGDAWRRTRGAARSLRTAMVIGGEAGRRGGRH